MGVTRRQISNSRLIRGKLACLTLFPSGARARLQDGGPPRGEAGPYDRFQHQIHPLGLPVSRFVQRNFDGRFGFGPHVRKIGKMGMKVTEWEPMTQAGCSALLIYAERRGAKNQFAGTSPRSGGRVVPSRPATAHPAGRPVPGDASPLTPGLAASAKWARGDIVET